MIMEIKCPVCGTEEYDYNLDDETYDNFYKYIEQKCICKNGHEFHIAFIRKDEHIIVTKDENELEEIIYTNKLELE